MKKKKTKKVLDEDQGVRPGGVRRGLDDGKLVRQPEAPKNFDEDCGRRRGGVLRTSSFVRRRIG